MIEEQAQVVRVSDGFAEIVTLRRDACGSCAAKDGCGTSLLAAWFPRRQFSFLVKNDIAAVAGDEVIVGLDEGQLQRGSLLLYAVPLAGLLLGAILGERAFAGLGLSSELGSVVLGLSGLIVALMLVRRTASKALIGGEAGDRLLRLARRPVAFSASGILMPQAQQTQGSGSRQ